MAKSKHTTTKRGSQKARAAQHDAYLAAKHPNLWGHLAATPKDKE